MEQQKLWVGIGQQTRRFNMTITAEYINPEHTLLKRSDMPGASIPTVGGNRHYSELLELGITIADYVVEQPTVEKLRSYLAEYRWTHETGGINIQVNGYNFNVATDDRSQIKMTAILLEASTDPTFTTPFKNQAGTFVTLNALECATMARAVGDHVKKAFASEETVLAAINADPPTVTTYAQVEAAYDTAYAS